MTDATLDITGIYRQRFVDTDFRKEMWEVLCRDYFQKLVPGDATVLEVACGYCEFINSISAKKKMGIDLNPDSKKYANADVEVHVGRSTDMSTIADSSVDVVFMSNFLEHITREDIQMTLKECHRVLRKGGNVIILQPNIRYLANDYWMFIDHITPVDDRALCELLGVLGYSTIRSKPKFLPYTTQGRLPNSISLLKLYLKIPLLHWLMGKQALVIATK